MKYDESGAYNWAAGSAVREVLFEGLDARGLQRQEWFIHIGAGGNIRAADTPIKLTRRMAHAFPEAPRGNSLERNLRWAQVVGMGGSERLANAVLRTRLGRHLPRRGQPAAAILRPGLRSPSRPRSHYRNPHDRMRALS